MLTHSTSVTRRQGFRWSRFLAAPLTVSAASLGLFAVGCSGGASSAGDAGTGDAAKSDAGKADAGRSEAGKSEAGRRDAGTSDGGRRDTGAGDAGMTDGGSADVGLGDAGSRDAGMPGPPTTPAFYVSPSGDDANPGTVAQPFLTLPKAQAAMRASASIKTTFLRAGTYTVTASTAASNCTGGGSTAIDLGGPDDGETWSYYPPDGYGSAIIDGASTSASTGLACAFAASGASNLTFTGLQIQRFQYSGIYASSSPNLSVKDNTIHDLTVAVYNVGGVAIFSSSGATVANNYIHDVAYVGVGVWGAGISNATVSGNVVLSSCSAAAQPGGNDMDGGDCGAIYLWDGQTHASTNLVVTGNYVRDVNVSSNGAGDYTGCCATGIYLDDGMSNVTVSGNVVTGTKSQCFVIHGGNDDTFKDNLCDLDNSMYQRVMTYQWDALMLPMSGNVIEDNIIVAGSTSGGTGYADDGTPTPPTIKNNAYYNYVGTKVVSTGGNGSDSNPTYENPGISCWDPSVAASSPVYAAPVSFVKLPGGWGPPGFVLPKTGTPPSWPHGC